MQKVPQAGAHRITEPTTIWLHETHCEHFALHELLKDTKHARAWLYTMNENFFTLYVDRYLEHGQLFVITDYRTRKVAAGLARRFPNFHARHWSANRTMHDKTWVSETPPMALLTTANATAGAWTHSRNRTIRIASPDLAARLVEHFETDWLQCRAILPS